MGSDNEKPRSNAAFEVPKKLAYLFALLGVAGWVCAIFGGGEILAVQTPQVIQQEQFGNLAVRESNNVRGSARYPNGDCQLPETIVIDAAAVIIQDVSRFAETMHLTKENHAQYYADPKYGVTGGKNKQHYTLLHHLATEYGDCRPIVDIGTRYICSSLAMASSRKKVEVWTFDIPLGKKGLEGTERILAYRGKSEEEWEQAAKAAGVGKIKFHNLDLLKVSDSELRGYMATWLIVLDTFHLPDKKPFEREFLARIVKMGYRGLMILDDIHLNSEMRRWWEEILENAENWGYTAHDLTSVGHGGKSGTGLLDFSGKVDWIPLQN